MTQYCIALGDNRRVTPRAYLAALRMAQANLDATFAESFTSSWIPATGAEIVSQWRTMLRAKWASQLPTCGKGNRANKRAQAIRDAHATCKWCGSPTGAERTRFCSKECARDYNS